MIGELQLIQSLTPAPAAAPPGAGGSGESDPFSGRLAQAMASAVDADAVGSEQALRPAVPGDGMPAARVALGWALGRLAQEENGDQSARIGTGRHGVLSGDVAEPAPEVPDDTDVEGPDPSLLASAVSVPTPAVVSVDRRLPAGDGDTAQSTEATAGGEGAASAPVRREGGQALTSGARGLAAGPYAAPSTESQVESAVPTGQDTIARPAEPETSPIVRASGPREGAVPEVPTESGRGDMSVRQVAAAAVGAALAAEGGLEPGGAGTPEPASVVPTVAAGPEAPPANGSASAVLPPGVLAAARRAWQRAEGPVMAALQPVRSPETVSAGVSQETATAGQALGGVAEGPAVRQRPGAPSSAPSETVVGPVLPGPGTGGVRADGPTGDPSSQGESDSRQGQSRRAALMAMVTGPATQVPAVFDAVLGAPAATVATPVAAPVPEALTPEAGAQVSAQLIQTLRMQFKDGIGDAVLHLRPEHLGEVTVALRVDHGVVSATVQAEEPAVRQWLASQESALREGLSQHGLDLGSLVVEPDGQREREGHEEEAQSRRRAPKRNTPDTGRFEILM